MKTETKETFFLEVFMTREGCFLQKINESEKERTFVWKENCKNSIRIILDLQQVDNIFRPKSPAEANN